VFTNGECLVEEEKWLTVEEVAVIASVHEQTVRRWLRTEQLRGHLINRRAGYRVQLSHLRMFLSGECQGNEMEEPQTPEWSTPTVSAP
jgi:excisionase family DNA binding protein